MSSENMLSLFSIIIYLGTFIWMIFYLIKHPANNEVTQFSFGISESIGVLKFLANNGEKTTDEIATSLGISPHFIKIILLHMARGQLVKHNKEVETFCITTNGRQKLNEFDMSSSKKNG